MRAYRVETRVEEDGSVHLKALPFRKGERVEIIVRSREEEDDARVPPAALEGSVLRYEAPTEPVAEDDWDALR